MKQQLVKMSDVVHDMKIKVKNEIEDHILPCQQRKIF